MKSPFKYFPFFLVLYEFSTYIANDMIMPGMPLVVRQFGASNSYVATSLTAYLLGGASLQLFLGPISDRFGRRSVLLFGTLLFFIFTLGITKSDNIEYFMVMRFLQGMGLSFIGVVGYAALHELYEEKDAVQISSWMASVALIAPLIGPLAGSLYIFYSSWQNIFYSIAILALGALVGLYSSMPESVHLAYIKTKMPPTTKPDLSVVPKLNLSFVIANYSKLLTDRLFMSMILAYAVISTPLLVWIAMSPLILLEKEGMSEFGYGLFQLPVFGCLIFGNIYLNRITKQKKDLYSVVRYGMFYICFGLLLSAACPFFLGNSILPFVLPICIYCFGLGIAWAPMTRLLLFSTNVAKGTSSAAFNLSVYVFQGICVAIMPKLYEKQQNLNLGLAFAFCVPFALFLWPLYPKESRKNPVVSGFLS